MSNPFFERPIVNSPYAYPHQHWELDQSGQPSGNLIERRRRAEFITPIPKPKKRRGGAKQEELILDEGRGLTTKKQAYDLTSVAGGDLDPLKLPNKLQTALEALYGHYQRTFELWQKRGISVPPCFIVVCQNTAFSKLVHDYISGFYQKDELGGEKLVQGRLALFRNFDDTAGNALARPNTLLIDSEELGSGEALDDKFRAMAADEIVRCDSHCWSLTRCHGRLGSVNAHSQAADMAGGG